MKPIGQQVEILNLLSCKTCIIINLCVVYTCTSKEWKRKNSCIRLKWVSNKKKQPSLPSIYIITVRKIQIKFVFVKYMLIIIFDLWNYFCVVKNTYVFLFFTFWIMQVEIILLSTVAKSNIFPPHTWVEFVL